MAAAKPIVVTIPGVGSPALKRWTRAVKSVDPQKRHRGGLAMEGPFLDIGSTHALLPGTVIVCYGQDAMVPGIDNAEVWVYMLGDDGRWREMFRKHRLTEHGWSQHVFDLVARLVVDHPEAAQSVPAQKMARRYYKTHLPGQNPRYTNTQDPGTVIGTPIVAREALQRVVDWYFLASRKGLDALEEAVDVPFPMPVVAAALEECTPQITHSLEA